MIRLQRLFLVFSLILLSSAMAHADGDRISLGVGIATTNSPSQTSFELGVEYEHRLDPMFGLGIVGNYIFSSPGILFIGFPDLFLHPLAGDWVVFGTPLLETGGNIGTHLGTRIGTRVPIPLGVVTLEPSFAIDFINGGRNYWYGLGFEF